MDGKLSTLGVSNSPLSATPAHAIQPPAISGPAVAPPKAAPQPEQGSQNPASRILLALLGKPVNADTLLRAEEALAKLNEMLRDKARDLEFSIDEVTGRTILKVIHAESGEVIRQIPPEELLQIARAFTEGTGSLIEDLA